MIDIPAVFDIWYLLVCGVPLSKSLVFSIFYYIVLSLYCLSVFDLPSDFLFSIYRFFLYSI